MRTLFLLRLALFVLILCWIWHKNNSLEVKEEWQIDSENFKEKAIDITELLSPKCSASQKTVQLENGKLRDY